MKRRITLSIALALIVVLLSLMSSDSTANAARTRRFVADTGMITLGPNQSLRVTVTPSEGPEESITFVYGQLIYAQGTCDGGVCRHSISSQTTTDPVTLMPGEAASMDIARTPSSSGVRAEVVSDSPDMVVDVLVIDGTTGGVASIGLPKFTPKYAD